MALSRRRALLRLLWACAALALIGAALTALQGYRDALGVVRTPAGVFVRIGPGLLCAAIHAGCALRAGVQDAAGGRIAWICAAFDMGVGAMMWIPWAGLWIALLSPFSSVTFMAAYTRPALLIAAFIVTSVATLGTGLWILWQSRSGG